MHEGAVSPAALFEGEGNVDICNRVAISLQISRERSK